MRGQYGTQFRSGPLGVAEGVAGEEIMQSRHGQPRHSISRAKDAAHSARTRLGTSTWSKSRTATTSWTSACASWTNAAVSS